MKLNNERLRMNEENPLLTDFLEELKTFKEGVFLDKTISIFYNDWSLNPDYEDDYSERVTLIDEKLKNLNPKEFKSYRVAWWDQSILVPNFVDICVKKTNNENNKIIKTTELTDEEFKELKDLLNTEISEFLDTSFVIGSEDGKQHIIKQANIYKRIYNKLIKPIYKVDD